MSNFDFLRNYDEDLYKAGINIEKNVSTSPAAVLSYATPFLERVLELLMAEIGQKFNRRKEFYYQLDAVHRAGKIKYGFKQNIYGAYQLRNRIHDNIDEMERSEFFIAQQLHQKLFHIAKKLYEDFFPDKDRYGEVPSFRPIEIAPSDDKLELIKIPDFPEIIDIDYDYCIICGKSNHISNSLCCHECNRVLDNANNYISIRNYLGTEKPFTKQQLIDYGIPEGYVNQFISSMVRENMLHAKGIYYSFNSMHLDEFLRKIDNYIAICELITKFREDKISPGVIKTTREYKEGSLKHEPFHQFYTIINREIVKMFERDLFKTENILNSIAYTTITQRQLDRWYDLELARYKKGQVNKSFVLYNRLLIEDYLSLKRLGMTEGDIKQQLNVTDKIYGFWLQFDHYFEAKVKQIKIDLLKDAILDGKTRDEVLLYAGVTSKEYDDLVKVSNYKNDDFSKLRNKEIESRKRQFVKYLLNFDLRIACKKAKITLEDFYEHYESGDVKSEFHVKSTGILMDKFLLQRSRGRSSAQAMEIVGIKKKYLDHWNSWPEYEDFRDNHLDIKIDLVIKGFKQKKSLIEIAKFSEMSVDAIKRNIMVIGNLGSEKFRRLYEFYSEKVLPGVLSEFLEIADSKSIRKAIESVDLTEDEINHYYQLGKSGDERFSEFYEELFKIKKSTYLFNKANDKSHEIAMRESRFTVEEYEENRQSLDESIINIKKILVADAILDNKTSSIAARKANVSVDEIYEWYFKGRDGDEDYKDFYEIFHAKYVRPNINSIQKSLDSNKSNLDILIKSNKTEFTKKDIEIWVNNGLLDNKVLTLEKDSNEDDDDKKVKSKFNANEMLREMGVEDYDKIAMRKNTNSSSILSKKDQDVEKLKREILKK